MKSACFPIDTIINGDCITELRELPAGIAHTCVTSPPYWGLRDYGVEGQIGLEKTPDEFIDKMVAVFREVWRVLRDDGTLWINLGDSYASAGGAGWKGTLRKRSAVGRLKPKDLIGMPWEVAFALRDDGWYLRQEIIWHKPNPMPESVTDRPTRSHEQIFQLSKVPEYYYDNEIIMEACSPNTHARLAQNIDEQQGSFRANGGTRPDRPLGAVFSKKMGGGVNPKAALNSPGSRQNESFSAAVAQIVPFRNKRTVWTVASQALKEAHFATFPPDLIEPCILAGAPEGGLVLDPFMGSGTTALVAKENGRHFIGVELNPAYIAIAEKRIAGVEYQPPLFARSKEVANP